METSDRLFALGVVTAGAYWAAASAAAVLAAFAQGSGRPELSPAAPFSLLLTPTIPSSAFGPAVGSGWLYWTAFGLAVGLAFLPILYVGLRRSNTGLLRAGCASSSGVSASAGRRALLRRARSLRPSLGSARPVDLGYRLGSSQGTACHASIEDSVVVLGPPRSGKGFHLVVPMVLDAPGAVLTTSTRPDNLTVTLRARARQGPVAVFDPQGLAPGITSATRWSPIRGCEDPHIAMIRAKALTANTASGTTDSTFWQGLSGECRPLTFANVPRSRRRRSSRSCGRRLQNAITPSSVMSH